MKIIGRTKGIVLSYEEAVNFNGKGCFKDDDIFGIINRSHYGNCIIVLKVELKEVKLYEHDLISRLEDVYFYHSYIIDDTINDIMFGGKWCADLILGEAIFVSSHDARLFEVNFYLG